MVAQQGETVQRIDADTSDIAQNVGGAQRELLKYYTSVSGNRALMLKVFGVLIVFFVRYKLYFVAPPCGLTYSMVSSYLCWLRRCLAIDASHCKRSGCRAGNYQAITRTTFYRFYNACQRVSQAKNFAQRKHRLC